MWLKKSSSEPLTVSMSGVKLADRVLIAGARDAGLIAGVAAKTGLTGRTCVVDAEPGRAAAAVAAAERAGALAEAFTAPWTTLPFERETFDLVILRDVLPALSPDVRSGVLGEILRVLRPGGRGLVIDAAGRGLRAIIGGRAGADPATILDALGARGFRAVRTLAARDGLLFIEGVRPNL